MEKIKNFLLLQQENTTTLTDFIINAIICIGLSAIIAYLYTKYGFSLSNKVRFAQNFILLSITTMVVITIVKSSLALSLGLVGALSIVRFRTPIKDPEELMMLFINLAIGLGLGADQRAISFISTVFFGLIIVIRYMRNKALLIELDTILLIEYHGNNVDSYHEIIKSVTENADEVILKRLEYKSSAYEILFSIALKNTTQLEKLIYEAKQKESSLQISIITSK